MMKIIVKLTANILLISLLVVFTGCSVDNLDQVGNVRESQIAKNEGSARTAVNGIYSLTRPEESSLHTLTLLFTLAGLEQKPSGAASQSFTAYHNNNVKAELRGGNLSRFYTKSYTLINLASVVIKKLDEAQRDKSTDISAVKINQFKAEAMTLRANAQFTLLRIFGQFYDVKSKYGIAATREVVTPFTYLKRSSVAETYEIIIKDLEFAIKHLLNNRGFNYVNKSYAEALLAKVYLSKGDYKNAVKYAGNVINNSGGNFKLEEKYDAIFQLGTSGVNESKELLYAPFYKVGASFEESASAFRSANSAPSDYLLALADAQVGKPKDGKKGPVELVDSKGKKIKIVGYAKGYDPRFKFTFLDTPNSIYFKSYSASHSYYYMRMGEVYLIYAEALARVGDSKKAIEALNKIRKRAGVAPKVYQPYNKKVFLEDVRKEKLLELSLETAEPWFDLVRYVVSGDIDPNVLKVKPNLKNKNKLIFPIPITILRNNKNFKLQNPSYKGI